MRPALPLLLLCAGAALSGETWLTFFSAYQDGLEAQARGDQARAARAFGKAVALAPVPGRRVKTYGLNFLDGYHPYLRLAEVFLAQGDLAKAEAALARSQTYGIEPAPEREALLARLRARRQAVAGPVPAPRATVPVPAKAAPPVPAKATPAPATVEEPTPAPPRAAAPEQGALPAAAGPGKAKAAPASPHPVQVVPAAAAKVAPQPPPAAGPGPRPARPYRGWALGMGAALLLGSLGALWRRRRRPQLGPWGAPLDPRQQTRYGPYGINGILGVGGCATAYRGQHLGTGAAVAVKVPHPHLVRDPEFRARFQREADLGARLEHPRIVPILASGVEEEEPWLAMPFIEGLTLDLRLGRGGPLPLAEALAIATGIAEAIAYAHTRSVVHRDLKPANLILTPKGVMVMDFGIARVLDASQTTSTLFLGTPAYAAPECVTTPQVGPPADRYALGIILFEMLTGHPPFTGQSPFQILEAHCSQPLPPCPQAPPAVLQLLQRLCAKAPEARPEDGEVLAILERLRANDTSSRS